MLLNQFPCPLLHLSKLVASLLVESDVPLELGESLGDEIRIPLSNRFVARVEKIPLAREAHGLSFTSRQHGVPFCSNARPHHTLSRG